MIAARTPFILVLSACEPSPSGALVLVEDEDKEAHPFDPEDVGTSEDTSAQTGSSCGGVDAAAEDGDLALIGCARVSPEPEDAWDTGDTGLLGLDSGAVALPGPPPPCGFYNLVGAVAPSGDPAAPDLLYCDADEDGGVRSVHVDLAAGEVDRGLLVSGVCWIDPQTGAVAKDDDAAQAWWIDLAGSEDGSQPQVMTAPLQADAYGVDRLSAQPTRVPDTAGARRVSLVPGASAGLIFQDSEGGLWWASGDTSPALLATNVWNYGAVSDDSQLYTAVCTTDETSTLVVSAASRDGTPTWTWTGASAACGVDARPALAVEDGALAVAWDDSDDGYVALLGLDGGLKVEIGLGKEALYPQVLFEEGALWTLDGAGYLSAWGLDGASLGTWRNATIAAHLGDVAGLRLRVEDGVFGYTLLGMDAVATTTGHLYTFYYLELSASEVPTL